MSSQVARALAVLDALFGHPGGRSLGALAAACGLSKPNAYRALAELTAHGLVRQDPQSRDYVLAYRIVGQSLRHLAQTGVRDIAQPVLDRLARQCGELVRLAAFDGVDLVYVLWSQGCTEGLRYEPVNGDVVPLFCTAGGHALLASYSDDDALRRVVRQGIDPAGYGPSAPRSLEAVLDRVKAARSRGYGHVVDSFAAGMTAFACCVRSDAGGVAGVVSAAIPTARVTAAHENRIVPLLLAAAAELSAIRGVSPILSKLG